jgi:hypothetical protein
MFEVKINGIPIGKVARFNYDTNIMYDSINIFNGIAPALKMQSGEKVDIRIDVLVGNHDGPDKGQIQLMHLHRSRSRMRLDSSALFEAKQYGQIITFDLFTIEEVSLYHTMLFDDRDRIFSYLVSSTTYKMSKTYDVERVVNAQVEHLLKPLYE